MDPLSVVLLFYNHDCALLVKAVKSREAVEVEEGDKEDNLQDHFDNQHQHRRLLSTKCGGLLFALKTNCCFQYTAVHWIGVVLLENVQTTNIMKSSSIVRLFHQSGALLRHE